MNYKSVILLEGRENGVKIPINKTIERKFTNEQDAQNFIVGWRESSRFIGATIKKEN